MQNPIQRFIIYKADESIQQCSCCVLETIGFPVPGYIANGCSGLACGLTGSDILTPTRYHLPGKFSKHCQHGIAGRSRITCLLPETVNLLQPEHGGCYIMVYNVPGKSASLLK